MPKIHCLNNISAKGTDLLPAGYELTDSAEAATGILVRSAAMHDMAFGSELLAIARAGAGVNNIPLDRCAEEGIVVFNTPGANANAVKELVLAGMLLSCRDIVGGIAWCKENADDADIAKTVEKAKKAFAGTEIAGKKLGVVGLGAIGALVANACIKLGMDVYGYDPYLSANAAWNISRSVHHITDVNEIYANCDFITIHVPALDSTKGMVGFDALSRMKEGAVVLNFARDTLVDSAAMTAALESGKLRAYVTDFPTPEVMAMPGAIVIPHLGASTEEAEDNCAVMAVREMVDYLENGNIANSVNYPACDLGAVAEGAGRIVVLHDNIPNMVGQVSSVLGDAGVNIANMANQSRGSFACTLIGLDTPAPAGVDSALAAIEGVRRVRVIA